MKTHEHKNTAYFETFIQARDHGEKYGKGFPNWRVVPYGRGWGVQAYISGPYFNLKGEVKGEVHFTSPSPLRGEVK